MGAKADKERFPRVDADGFNSLYLGDAAKSLQYPGYNASSLLAVNKDKNPPTVYQVGKQIKITLAPGETLTFLNNDLPTYYSDNEGSITVKWSNCD